MGRPLDNVSFKAITDSDLAVEHEYFRRRADELRRQGSPITFASVWRDEAAREIERRAALSKGHAGA
jgi:hypothetical protein